VRPVALGVAALLLACGDGGAPGTPTYVGRGACVPCHAREDSLWRGSPHDLAMQEATGATVLGDFGDVTLTAHGTTSRFFRGDSAYVVRTDGPDGRLADYPIAFVFGVYPLQQYLVALPGGRLQALALAWDSRPRARGGQRWFHLYPDRPLRAGDPLHWTGIDQTWNYQCAECHSTNLRKGYDPGTNVYATTWSELDVSCEACHGPGSVHVARAADQGRGRESGTGMVAALVDSGAPAWVMDPGTGIARRSAPPASRTEVETCARCHARRGTLSEDHVAGRPLVQTHRPALLVEGLYESDGQMQDEVYNYGSFLQSRMYAAGVTCSDCHDPHRADVPTDASCARCHLPARFASPEHHQHDVGSAGARCVACHMPERLYMVIDARHDHSFRRPRPDLSVRLGTSNACTDCHRDRSAAWAAAAAARWYPGLAARAHWAVAIDAGRRRLVEGGALLPALIEDTTQPGIVRATAVSLLAAYRGAGVTSALQAALWDADPLVRAAAAEQLDRFDPPTRVAMAADLLVDSVRLVRITVGRALAGIGAPPLDDAQRGARDAALEEYRVAQRAIADRPEGHLALGALALDEGDAAGAEREYRTALGLDSTAVAAWVNLADLYRATGRDGEAEPLLRRAIAAAPADAAPHYALGLLFVRAQRSRESLVELRRATQLAPSEPRYGLAYGLALQRSGRTRAALTALSEAHGRAPADADLLVALATLSRDAGDRASAVAYARRLLALDPADPGARQLLAELGAAP
jgi:tetratricopeptide (TPR) repeat protein